MKAHFYIAVKFSSPGSSYSERESLNAYTTVGDCSSECTIDVDHIGQDVHYQIYVGSVKVRMLNSCNTCTKYL